MIKWPAFLANRCGACLAHTKLQFTSKLYMAPPPHSVSLSSPMLRIVSRLFDALTCMLLSIHHEGSLECIVKILYSKQKLVEVLMCYVGLYILNTNRFTEPVMGWYQNISICKDFCWFFLCLILEIFRLPLLFLISLLSPPRPPLSYIILRLSYITVTCILLSTHLCMSCFYDFCLK